MSLRKSLITVATIVIMTAAVPRQAAADWLFTPFIGSTFGGSANIGGGIPTSRSEFERKLNWGASLSGGGVVGFELDFSYSPNFFGVTDSSSGVDFLGDGNVTTLTGNLRLAVPSGPIRPYAVAGVGLIRSKVDDPTQFFSKPSASDFGMDVGAGIDAFFSPAVGVRGDFRYFRSFEEDDSTALDLSLGSFNFWRASVGVTFKF
jgi:opacity protein-like surface antigen